MRKKEPALRDVEASTIAELTAPDLLEVIAGLRRDFDNGDKRAPLLALGTAKFGGLDAPQWAWMAVVDIARDWLDGEGDNLQDAFGLRRTGNADSLRIQRHEYDVFFTARELMEKLGKKTLGEAEWERVAETVVSQFGAPAFKGRTARGMYSKLCKRVGIK